MVRFCESMQQATIHIKHVNQNVKMYYAIHEAEINECEYTYLWKEIKKIGLGTQKIQFGFVEIFKV